MKILSPIMISLPSPIDGLLVRFKCNAGDDDCRVDLVLLPCFRSLLDSSTSLSLSVEEISALVAMLSPPPLLLDFIFRSRSMGISMVLDNTRQNTMVFRIFSAESEEKTGILDLIRKSYLCFHVNVQSTSGNWSSKCDSLEALRDKLTSRLCHGVDGSVSEDEICSAGISVCDAAMF